MILGKKERDLVRAAVYRVLKNDADTEDATQDALLLAHQARNNFRGEALPSSWLFRIALNTAYALLRARRAKKRTPVTMPEREPPFTPEKIAIVRDEVRRVLATVEGELNQKVLELHVVGPLSIEETADQLQLSVAAVKSRAHQIRLRARAAE